MSFQTKRTKKKNRRKKHKVAIARNNIWSDSDSPTNFEQKSRSSDQKETEDPRENTNTNNLWNIYGLSET